MTDEHPVEKAMGKLDLKVSASGHKGDDPRYSALVAEKKEWRRKYRAALDEMQEMQENQLRLETQLRQARLVFAAAVETAGGRLFVSEDVLETIEGGRILSEYDALQRGYIYCFGKDVAPTEPPDTTQKEGE